MRAGLKNYAIWDNATFKISEIINIPTLHYSEYWILPVYDSMIFWNNINSNLALFRILEFGKYSELTNN
ncbi:MAG: hypothetical protein ACE5J3_08705, partial [Methanosarcinales archaeon]